MSQLISIIMPVHNGEKYLAEALRSIEKQNYNPLEIIVIDDGSIDNSAQIARAFPNVLYNYYACDGPAAARNRGLEIAQGSFITFLDCDDFWAEKFLTNFANYLVEHPNTGMIQGLLQFYFTDIPDPFNHSLQPRFSIQLGTVLYRRNLFDLVGKFDEGLYSGQDADWLMRAWELGIPKDRLNQIVLYYRRHQTNLTNSFNIVAKSRLAIFQRHLMRIRQAHLNPADYDRSSLLDYLGAWPGEITE